MSSGQDFSEDITNGGFSSEMQNNGGDEEMQQGQSTEDNTEGQQMSQDDSMPGGNSGQEGQETVQGTGRNGEAMEQQSTDTGSADQYGKDDDRKLFIGGLSWETTEKDLREYFAKYGGIESLTLKMDPTTGRSRGFAFIVFSEVATLDKVIAAGEHVINGKKVDPKKAKARHGKIFVGGLTQEISDDDIKTYFSQFGNVVDVEMPIDKTKNQRKGFCFITFDNEQIVHELLKTPKQTISGKEVDVKKAQPPQNARGVGVGPWGPMGMPVRGARGAGAVRGGRGRGRGDWAGGWGGGGYTSAASGYSSAGYGGYQNYGAGAARGYGYGGAYPYDYDGYSYTGYDGYGYEQDYSQRGAGRGGARGFPGKTRGTRGGMNIAGNRHTPY